MSFAQHDHMIQTLSAYRPDDPFTVRILPWRTRCDQRFFDSHAFDTLGEVVSVDAISIADQETWTRLVGKGVDDLLSGPFGVGIGGDVEVTDFSAVMTHHDEDVQNPERDRGNREEITSSNIGHVVSQGRSPSLGWWLSVSDHVLGHGLLGDVVTQQKQLRSDPWRAPSGMLSGHASNQVLDFPIDGWASRFAGPGLPPPIQAESLMLPFDDRFGLHDGQGGSPVGPEAGEPRPEDPVAWPQSRAFDGVLEDGNLLSQCEVLSGDSSAANDECPEKQEAALDDARDVVFARNRSSYWLTPS